MTRAERRRIEREAKQMAKRGDVPLQLVQESIAPIEMTPARIAAMKREIADDLIRRSGDKFAIQQARMDGYEQGKADGQTIAERHYLRLLYICLGLALESTYGFKCRRISRVWHEIDNNMGEMLHLLDDGLPLDEIEEMYNSRLDRLTGMKFELTGSADDLRANDGYNREADA